MKILPVSGLLGAATSVVIHVGAGAMPLIVQQPGHHGEGLTILAQLAQAPPPDGQPQTGDPSQGPAPAPAPQPSIGTTQTPAPQQPATAAAPPAVVLTPNGTAQPPGTAATNGRGPQRGRLQRGNTGSQFGSTQPSGALPTYGSTSPLDGSPQSDGIQPSTGTQRNPTNPMMGDTPAYGGQQVYGGTQSTLGTPQLSGTQSYGGTQAYGGTQPYGGPQPYGGTQPNAGTQTGISQGGGTIYTRQPLGASPTTRDLTGTYGGSNGFDARGVYTGTAAQPLSYGQLYATPRSVNNNLLGNGLDARSITRPFIPLGTGPGRPNSGYGIPNGSKPTYMDARGVQRSN
ncbi:hypothetical protein [Lichenifustis flavocetrariae]|uniref:Uncharacterized protein n=1 Tax=Lichenifustis flavocetrariae TaxID=2949735 RepID=A0AA42CMK5_9HYPH|nr:hypothetical protein [Lichenifustis flavocetrariae]MCW6508450.1 hypothetical protein [Lichenifustis flavocetrariae]